MLTTREHPCHCFITDKSMIKKLLFVLPFCLPLLCSACSDDYKDSISEGPAEANATVSLSAETVNFDYNAGAQTLTISADHEWCAVGSDSWITFDPTYSLSSSTTMTVSVSDNALPSTRQGTITIMCGTVRKEIAVVQGGDASADEIRCPIDGYKLVWNDEFEDGDVLSSDWTHEVQNAYWVNGEEQYYVNGSANGKRVTELADGKLVITCFKGSDGKIYSARIYPKKNVGWKYGYFEARILLPQGKGTWPAWWMMPVSYDDINNPWPGCGEIDIMEEVGVDANWISSTIHCKKYNNSGTAIETAKRFVDTAESDYHNYAVEWTEDYMSFYIDEELLLTYNNDGTGSDAYPFTYSFYPILNIAWGGSWGGYAGTDESALPCTMKVEYVRIFQKE